MSLSDKLKDVQFKGFPKLEWDKILMRTSISRECGIQGKTFNLGCKVVLFSFLNKFNNYKIKEQSNAKLIFFQSDRIRPSCIKQFDSVTNLIDCDIITPTSKRYRFSLCYGFLILFIYTFSWYRALCKSKLKKDEIYTILLNLIELYYLQLDLKSLDFNKYRLLTVFYDSIIAESFLVHLFKVKSIKTATLQHGALNAYREDVLENSGVEFRSSFSDYFLCWNKFTIDEAKKEGLADQRLKTLGIIGYVGEDTTPCTPPYNSTFGVVIGHPMFEQENIELIKSANILAQNTQQHYYLKLHPNYKEDHFNSIIDKNYYKGNIAKGIQMNKYANLVDFSVIGSTSVYMELTYLGHESLKYSNNDVKDKFRDVKIGNIFTRPDDIVRCYNTRSKDVSEKLFDYLCTVKDVKASYTNFFKDFAK